jgi:negative regulator of sigma-B (phosphoserine phosphatase)
MPSIRVTGTELEVGDVMVLATDGIDSGFAQQITAGGAAQDIADRILAAHGKQSDDALVVVIRYLAA